MALNQYRGVASVGQVLRLSQLPVGLPPLAAMTIQVVAGGGNDLIELLHFRGHVAVLGGAGSDTVNVGDRNLLNGVLGTLLYDGDAHIVELARQATAGDFPGGILNNLPNVFVGTDPSKAFIGGDGTVFLYDDPVLASIVFGNETPQPHLSGSPLITGPLQVRAVVLHAANVQERGVHERGVQKVTDTGTPLWIGLDGNETIDRNQTGIPVIVRAIAGGQLVFLDADGNRVFSNTGLASIAAALGSEVAQLVFRDAQGRKTLTDTGRPSWQFLEGDLVEDLVQLEGVQERGLQERGVQKTDGLGQALWIGLNGNETTNSSETGIPVIVRVSTGGQLVFLNADGLRVFTATAVPSIIGVSTGGQLVFVDAAGNRFLTAGAGRRPSFVADFVNGVPLYVDQNGLKTNVLDTIVNAGGDGGVDLVVYAQGSHSFTDVVVRVCNGSTCTDISTSATTTVPDIVGAERHTGDRRGYVVEGNHTRIEITAPAGFLLDAVGIVAASRGSEGVAFPLIILAATSTPNGNAVRAGGVPDNVGFDLGGGTLAFQAMAPALVPVNRTQPKPFIRTFDVYEFHAGVDHLNVLGGATTAAVNGTLDVTQVAAPDLAPVTDGLDLQRHDGTRSERLTVSVGGDVTTSADVVDVSRVIVVRLDTNARVTGFGLSGVRTLTNLPANVQVLVVYATEKKFYVGGEPVYRVELFVNNQGQQDARLDPDHVRRRRARARRLHRACRCSTATASSSSTRRVIRSSTSAARRCSTTPPRSAATSAASVDPSHLDADR